MIISDYGRHQLIRDNKISTDFVRPDQSIPRSIGHHNEWIRACKSSDHANTTCKFAYSGPLTETVVLGNVAFRTGKTLQWEAKTMTATNNPTPYA